MKFYALLISFLLSACSVLPPVFNDSNIKHISYTQVLENKEDFEDTLVRWGGVIIGLENDTNQSTLQVMYYPLDRYGRPDIDNSSEGYFVIKSPEPLDPKQYTEGRELVAVGIIAKKEPSVSRGSTRLPLIKASGIHLWPITYRENYYFHCPSCYFQQLYW